jgi:hypothetical protein
MIAVFFMTDFSLQSLDHFCVVVFRWVERGSGCLPVRLQLSVGVRIRGISPAVFPVLSKKVSFRATVFLLDAETALLSLA